MTQPPSQRCVIDLAKNWEELKKKDVVVILLHSPVAQKQDITGWLKDHHVSFHADVMKGDVNKTLSNWGVRELPWLILADSNHVVWAEGFGVDEL